jgi:hypothetical protein
VFANVRRLRCGIKPLGAPVVSRAVIALAALCAAGVAISACGGSSPTKSNSNSSTGRSLSGQPKVGHHARWRPARNPRLSGREIVDKIRGGWVGAAVGGAWGAPTEFRYKGRTIPEAEVPTWRAEETNRYLTSGVPDETYVELPFLSVLDQRGIYSGWPEWGQAFRATRFPLYAANQQARANLALGLVPPASGDPSRNPYASDIDFQIESDFIGMIAPAQPGRAIDIAWRLGHVMNYGDGVYGGVMIAAMHAAAFRAKSVREIVAAGQRAIPVGTGYREMIGDVLRWHRRYPTSWQRTWRLLERRWNARTPLAKPDPKHIHSAFNIDAKLNGAYVLLGLLYDQGRFGRTTRIAMRAGQDSDCNPSNAASIIGNWRGFKQLPKRFTSGIDYQQPIRGPSESLGEAIGATQRVARRIVVAAGGRVGKEWMIVPAPTVQPIVERWPLRRDPGPHLDLRVTVRGRSVHLRAQGQDPDGIGAYWWSFGDLNDGRGSALRHRYRKAGTYRVIAWANDSHGRTTAASDKVTVP